MGKVIVCLLVGLVVMASAKPYESYRKPSAPNQYSVYPLYGGNVLFGTDRIPQEYLDRLFGERSKDGSVILPPFVRLPDELPNDRIDNEEDRLLIDPSLDEGHPDSPVDEIDEDIVEEREKPNKPVQKPDEENSDKEPAQEGKEENPNANGEKLKDDKQSDSPLDEIDGDIQPERKQPNKPDQKPKEENPDKEQSQDGKGGKPKENDTKGKESHEHEKRPKPGHPSIPKPPHKGNRPDVEKPSKDLARRDHLSPQQPGKNDRRNGPPQPPSPPRKPDAPLVQINVNVASPVL